MRKIYFLLIVTICLIQAQAQTVKKVNVLLVKRTDVLEKIALEQQLTNEDTTYYTALQGNKNYVEFPSNIFDHSAVSGHSILIQFLDNSGRPVTLTQANLASIRIFNKTVTDIDNNSKYVILDLKNL